MDNVSSETITYTYDALKRLVDANGSGWTEQYVYDGFGNMTQMNPTGGAPSLSVTVALDQNNVPTNRISASGVTYDNNGNQTEGFGGIGFSYDKADRISSAQVPASGTGYYAYDSTNHRIYYRNPSGTETVYLYGADGKKLAAYTVGFTQVGGGYTMQLSWQSNNVYFAGRLIEAENNYVATDRLGSVRSGGPGGLSHQAEYPYGVEYTTTANDREKYATYTRDSLTGMDYAMNRYYASQWGRALSPDPYSGSIVMSAPQSWNRYSYSNGDPVNRSDPNGLYAIAPGGPGSGFLGGDDPTCQTAADFWSQVGSPFGTPFPPSDPFIQSMSPCLGSMFAPWGNADTTGGGGGGELSKIDAKALAAYAHQFASALLSGSLSPNCAGDIAALGITPEQWADALNKVTILDGIGSQVPLASTLPNGSVAQQTAQARNLTVGGTFVSGATTAMASVNGPQVWINPFMVNPGEALEDTALVAHETLHNLGLIDSTIQQDLGLSVTSITHNITVKIQQDCLPGPPGPAPMP